MELSISPIIRQNSFTGERKQEHRNIRAKSTGTPQIITDNSFLKEQFAYIPLTDILNWEKFAISTPTEKNMERLIKAATGYLALYGKELQFTPSGDFGRDMTALIHTLTPLLPEGQSLNVDYADKEFVFVAYQELPKQDWSIICYIPVSIAETMRPTLWKLFIRFMAFMMQQNNLPTIKDTCEYEIFLDDVEYRMTEESEEVDECYIEVMQSYKDKNGKANRMLEQVKQCDNCQPDALLAELKNLKRLSKKEKEQVECMIRGLELMSRDTLAKYTYEDDYDNLNCEYTNSGEMVRWYDLVCVSWGTSEEDALIDYHFEGLSDRCNNCGATVPYSYKILSPEKPEKLTPCTFPFEWLDYICEDFFKHLTTNE